MTAEMTERLQAARQAAESVGAALMALRGVDVPVHEAAGEQVKTPVDDAAEAWTVAYLRARFPGDRFLSEEAFERAAVEWDAPRAYWTVDALDGTLSFINGFDGFCVQIAYVVDGEIRVGVVHEPVRRVTYWAVRQGGAYVAAFGDRARHLVLEGRGQAAPPIFVDSTRPSGPVGRLRSRWSGGFLECGSIGLKICRVAEGAADIFAKALNCKLWDLAPGDLILREAGGRLGRWDGEPIPYGGRRVYFDSLLASSATLFDLAIEELAGARPGPDPIGTGTEGETVWRT